MTFTINNGHIAFHNEVDAQTLTDIQTLAAVRVAENNRMGVTINQAAIWNHIAAVNEAIEAAEAIVTQPWVGVPGVPQAA